MTKLENVTCFLLDMDGTFYLGNKLIDGSVDFIEEVVKQGKNFIFMTNNSSKSKKNYVEKLENMGVYISPEQVFTSGEATTIYLHKKKPNAKIFLLGTKELEEEFLSANFQIIQEKDQEIDYVVLGFDQTLTYEKLWIACDYIRNGAEYIATHPDLNCPLEGGKMMPDTGAMIEMIKASTGKEPYIIGKPNSVMIESICEKYNYNKSELAIVGDRLYTDILTGINAEIPSVLVLSGETTAKDHSESKVQAAYEYKSLKYMIGDISHEEV